jgi:DNA-binding NarL/FixJ family response regulator
MTGQDRDRRSYAAEDPPHATTLRVLLVEDHASFRHALRAVFALEQDLSVVAEVDDGTQAAAAAADHRPDVAVVDLDLPGADGIEALVDIRHASPDTACVVLTALQDDAEMGRAVEAGAAAILHKSVDIDDLLQVIRRASTGMNLLSPNDTARWLQARGRQRDQRWQTALLEQKLTRREREVLALLAHGGTNQSIAQELVISPETVQTHVRNLMAKVDERSRLALVTTAIRLGIVDPPS